MRSNVAILPLLAFVAGVQAAPITLVSHTAAIEPIYINGRAAPAVGPVFDDPTKIDRRAKPVIGVVVDNPTTVDRRAAPSINRVVDDPTTVDRRAVPVVDLVIDDPTTVDRRTTLPVAVNAVAAEPLAINRKTHVERADFAIEPEL
jgi:hypothetical protein